MMGSGTVWGGSIRVASPLCTLASSTCRVQGTVGKHAVGVVIEAVLVAGGLDERALNEYSEWILQSLSIPQDPSCLAIAGLL